MYIRPLPSKMKPTIGVVILEVSTDAPTPTVMMATDPSTPTFQPSTWRKDVKRFGGHEDDDHRPRLRAELESDRGGYGVIEIQGAAATEQRSLAILSADAEARLDDRREDQDGFRPGDKLARSVNSPKEFSERCVDVVLNCGGGTRFSLRNCDHCEGGKPGDREHRRRAPEIYAHFIFPNCLRPTKLDLQK